VFGLPQRWNSGAYFYGYKKGLIKDGENPLLPMVHMVIPWMPIFHQQDYPYSTEVLFMPLRTFEVVKI
jgi:hypothetical protein